MQTYVALPFLALTLLRSGAHAQEVPAMNGCYVFDRPYFTWFAMRPGEPAGDSTRILHLLPTTASALRRLNSQLFDVRPVPFATDSFTIQRWTRYSYWTPSDSGFITVSWHNGLYGPVFRLKTIGDTLRGQVRFKTDVVGAEPPPATASAVRIACP